MTAINEAARIMGRAGGRARALALSPRRRRAIAKKARAALNGTLQGRRKGNRGRCSHCGEVGHYRTTCPLRGQLSNLLAP